MQQAVVSLLSACIQTTLPSVGCLGALLLHVVCRLNTISSVGRSLHMSIAMLVSQIIKQRVFQQTPGSMILPPELQVYNWGENPAENDLSSSPFQGFLNIKGQSESSRC